MVGPTKISTGPHVLEKQHFVGEKAEQWSMAPLFSEQWSYAPLLTVRVN
jgi:hypothetical protein